MSNLKNQRPEILFFDVNETLLDLEKVKQSIAKILEGNESLVTLWFQKMLHYSLVHTTSGTYENFGEIGKATLQMVAASNDITLNDQQALDAIKPIRSLTPHQDVKDALELLKKEGFKMMALTNGSDKALKEQLFNSGLSGFFELQLSIEAIKTFKPHSDVYKWAANKVGVEPENCMLIAAHGWDIAGALWAGWRGAFIARQGKQLYPLAPQPEINESDLLKVAKALSLLK